MTRITAPWKHILGTDRKYTARFDRAFANGTDITQPGTKPNPMDPEKVARKRAARKAVGS